MPAVFGLVLTEKSTMFCVPGTIASTRSPFAFTVRTLFELVDDDAALVKLVRRSPDVPAAAEVISSVLLGVLVPMPTLPPVKL